MRLGGFIQGIGLSVPEAREIVERAIAESPWSALADIEAEARLDADRAGVAIGGNADAVLEAVEATQAVGHMVEIRGGRLL